MLGGPAEARRVTQPLQIVEDERAAVEEPPATDGKVNREIWESGLSARRQSAQRSRCGCGALVHVGEWEDHLTHVCLNRGRFYCPIGCPDAVRTPGNVPLTLKELAGKVVQRRFPAGHPDLPEDLQDYITSRCFPLDTSAELVAHLADPGACSVRRLSCWPCERERHRQSPHVYRPWRGARDPGSSSNAEVDAEMPVEEGLSLSMEEWRAHANHHCVDSVRLFTFHPVPRSTLYTHHCYNCYSSFLNERALDEHHCGFYPHIAGIDTVADSNLGRAARGRADNGRIAKHGFYAHGMAPGAAPAAETRSGDEAGGSDGTQWEPDEAAAAVTAAAATSPAQPWAERHGEPGRDYSSPALWRPLAWVNPRPTSPLNLPPALRPLGTCPEITCPGCLNPVPTAAHLEHHRRSCDQGRRRVMRIAETPRVGGRRSVAETGAIMFARIRERVLRAPRVVWYRGLQSAPVAGMEQADLV